MRFKGTVLAATLAAALGLIPVTAHDARADVIASLPISTFRTIVADTAHGHLFITQYSGDTILVTDLFGAPVKTITGEGGVDALALSADGSTLYAALGTADAVSAISTTTLAETARYSLGSGNSPASLAVQSGKIWVSYTDTASTLPQGAIGEIDPAAAIPFTPAALPGTWFEQAPALSADPAGGGVLVARDGQYTAASYNVSTDPVTTLVAPNTISPCQYSGQLAVLAGGASVIMPCNGEVYRTSDLSEITDPYAGGLFPFFAVMPNGSVATAGTGQDASSGAPQVKVTFFAPDGTPQAAETLPYQVSTYHPSIAGIAWAADGSGAFVVIRNVSSLGSNPDTYTLREFFPAGSPTTLTLSGPATPPDDWPIGRTFGLTGTVTAASGPVAPGTVITITRTCPGTAAETLTATTGSGGAFSATDTLTALITCTYVASFGGSSALAPALAKVTVTGVKVRPVLTVHTSAGTVNYQSPVKVTVHLGTTDGNRNVALYAAAPGTTKRLLWNGPVNSAGNVTVQSPALTRNTDFVAVFGGDAGDVPVTTGQWVGVRVRVLEYIAGYYKTVRGTPVIRYYHRSGKVVLYTKVIPYKPGQCFKLQIQVRVGGAWKANGLSGCGHLSSTSLGGGYVTLKNAGLGYRYRVRIDYIPGKNDRNAAGYGSWMYFVVTT